MHLLRGRVSHRRYRLTAAALLQPFERTRPRVQQDSGRLPHDTPGASRSTACRVAPGPLFLILIGGLVPERAMISRNAPMILRAMANSAAVALAAVRVNTLLLGPQAMR